MEIHILNEFIRLVEIGSFQETAAQVNISASALTKHIQKLEEELGATLLERTQRGVQLNEYSRCFYPYAVQTVQSYEQGVRALRDMQRMDETVLTISYDPLLGQYGVPELLTSYSAQHPEIRINPVESYSARSLLEERKCQFAFVGETEASGADCCRMLYRTDTLAVVVPRDHRLAGSSTVSLSELAYESFILHSAAGLRPHDETRKFLELCEAEHFSPDVTAESHFTSTMLHYVKNGKGIAVLNRMHIPFGKNDFSVVVLEPPVQTNLYILYPQKMISPCARDFLHYLLDSCGG